jgi:phosphoadenosine phosphosulfate reductase
LIIRGQKDSDKMRGPLRSGDTRDGFEFLYPIQDWTDEQVFEYLKEIRVPIPPFYREGATSAPDCIFCTAWREHHGQEYIAKYYPQAAPELERRMRQVYG